MEIVGVGVNGRDRMGTIFAVGRGVLGWADGLGLARPRRGGNFTLS